METLDKHLVQNLQCNDTNAFDQLFWKYNHSIYLNVLKITKDVKASEDIVQEVFVTLWEKRLSINPEKSVANWIFVISYNKSIDYLKKSLKSCLFYRHINHYLLEDRPDNKELIEKQLSLIESAMNKLSPQKRKVFELCKLEGKTYEKAAEQLQISKHTVKEYLAAAMKNIREYVNTCEVIV